jgi:small subunit ribosomal protein S6
MRLYETAFLIAPNLPEEELESLLKKMQEVVSEKKGKMLNVDNWGKKKLAYSINKFEEATYVFFLYEGTPDIPVELERRFKQTEAIIRFLTVKKDPRDTVRKPGKKAKKKAKEIEEKSETETIQDEEIENEEADIEEESKEEDEKEELEERGNPDETGEKEPENNKIEEEKE